MNKRLLFIFTLLLTTVTGAWADDNFYFEVSGTTATLKYGEDYEMKPYYEKSHSNDEPWLDVGCPWYDKETIVTITVDASCQKFEGLTLTKFFMGFTNLETINDIGNLNMEYVDNMSYMFQGCSNLTTLNLNDWKTFTASNMSYMFQGCSNLTTLNISDWSMYRVTNTSSMFSGCSSLASFNIPTEMKAIGDNAFEGCTKLTSVTVYGSSCSLGNNAFSGCEKLTNIYVYSDLVGTYQDADNWRDYKGIIKAIPNQSGTCGTADHESDVTWELAFTSTTTVLTISGTGAMKDWQWDDETFKPQAKPWDSYKNKITSIIIGDGVTRIGNYAFYQCDNKLSVNIGNNVTTIGDSAFEGCLFMTTVAIGNNTETIGDNAFNFCAFLTTVDIPDGVTSIGEGAFNSCESLSTVTIGKGVASIGDDVFSGCPSLATIEVDEDNTTYDSRDHCNAIIKTTTKTLVAGCKNTIIPDGVESIGDSAFEGCSDLETIDIPASVTSIGYEAFEYCNNLAVTLNGGVTIGDDAFHSNATVKIADDLYLYNGTEVLSGNVTDMSKLKGKTLQEAIPYIDADGNTAYCTDFTVLTGGGATTLDAGWYVVNDDVTYTGTVTLNGDVNIILCDGKTMSVTNTGTTTDDRAIYGVSKVLHIYGQSLGTGALTATAVKGSSAISLVRNNGVGSRLGIHGGVVTATTSYSSGNGISVQCATDADGIIIDGGRVTASGGRTGIYCDGGHFDILGGQVIATGTVDGGLVICDGDKTPGILTLGYSKATDFISTNKIYNYSGGDDEGEVKIATGQTLSDGTNTYDDQTTSATLAALTDVILTPSTYGVTANEDPAHAGEYWSTFYHPTAGYQVDVNTTTAYIATLNSEETALTLTEVEGGFIPAGNAVILKSTSSSYDIDRAETGDAFDFTTNSLLGGSTVEAGKVVYTLAAAGDPKKVGFYKFTGTSLNPYKAHLECAPADSRDYYGLEESETTRMAPPTISPEGERPDVWYDLQGRTIANSQKPKAKGIYIHNGRKEVLK